MRKAIRLTVSVWVEGEDEPAHDFAARAKRALKAMLQGGADADPGLAVTVKKLEEATDDE